MPFSARISCSSLCLMACQLFGATGGIRTPSLRTIITGEPTAVYIGSKSCVTTEPAPIFVFAPMVTGPTHNHFAPIITLSSTVGWRLFSAYRCPALPPIITTLSPISAVSHNNACAVVNKEALADGCTGVNLNPCRKQDSCDTKRAGTSRPF